MTAVQDGPTSIRVSWTPSSDATGYRIHYTSSRGDSGSEDVSGGHSDSHTLTGLVKEDTYTISIMATFHTLSSSDISQHPPQHARAHYCSTAHATPAASGQGHAASCTNQVLASTLHQPFSFVSTPSFFAAISWIAPARQQWSPFC